MRKAATFRIDAELLASARRYARADSRTLTNLVETSLKSSVGEAPKPDPTYGARALHESERRLLFVLEAGCLGSWELDLASHCFTASITCLENLGLVPTGQPVTYDEVMARVHPADRLRQRLEVQKAIAAHSRFDVEYRVTSQTGEIRWVQLRGQAIYDHAGNDTHMTGVSLDVTERKRAEERQKLLLDELNHRVKNTLATVQALAMQTRRGASDHTTFTRDLDGRIAALARAHDLLTEASWEGASLSEIVDRTIDAYESDDETQPRISVAGPAVVLSPNAAVTLNMAFHELATNAAKYGALSVPEGRVAVRWQTVSEAGGRSVVIVWREEGGPVVRAPTRRGFGTRLLERGLVGELGGAVNLEFPETGIICRIHLPISLKVGLAA